MINVYPLLIKCILDINLEESGDYGVEVRSVEQKVHHKAWLLISQPWCCYWHHMAWHEIMTPLNDAPTLPQIYIYLQITASNP